MRYLRYRRCTRISYGYRKDQENASKTDLVNNNHHHHQPLPLPMAMPTESMVYLIHLVIIRGTRGMIERLK